ncbi:hypothetical protein CTM97_11740 [Photobacterium phosphoreum]|uniref:Endonuclease GajA/Old nuclease/RecF-like AAA domain-containing protein n=1 Tax=Photobacterium phosphoreum TaxID=659 RepID=A0A2T3JP10_PHOPO|nr:AAA family ATPase [Photobacterium phosphoreum]PSU26402.1 hypothetical protein CTM96_05155 [Photobacterium phosphoreum]PSU41879.1 hypothetical protein CTM97_11740 [Photobacterium phosphoreum]PSU50779.1 hypothetical protein C9J18_14115 [Photobacterium phosphoreum]
MDAIRIRNLRSFTNSPEDPYIELKPVTVFVGKNSCGKSTLLRTLPLLRQSSEALTNGPILWYGPLTDFGMFSNAINKKSKTDIIYFDFEFDDFIDHPDCKTKIEIGVSENVKQTIYRTLKITNKDVVIDISYHKKHKVSCVINDKQLSCSHVKYESNINQFLPRFSFEGSDTLDSRHYFDIESYNELIVSLYCAFDFDNDNTIWSDKIHQRFMRSGFNSKEKFIKIICSEFSIEKKDFLKKIISFNIDVNYIYTLYVSSYLQFIVRHIDHVLMMNFRNIRYVAPLRASAERFYRFQDYSLNELDSEGKNLAMLLSSLSDDKMCSFQRWTKDNFDFEVFIKKEGMHYQIMIDNDGDLTNIHDMGFGFSQILPIMASLWYESNKPLHGGFHPYRFNIDKIIAIEQPELHLHPELQAKLAKVIAKLVFGMQSKGYKFKVIFETHSKTMINALGDLVEDNPEYKNIINIVIFDKEDEYTRVKSVTFDDDGDLVNWPVGFFSGR